MNGVVRNRKRIAAALGAMAVLGLTALTLPQTGCAEPEPPPKILRPVRSQTVVASGGSRTRAFSGTARAGQETVLSFRVPGRIERLAVKVGDTVRAGQTIARLEQRDYEIDVGREEADLAQARATARNAEADLERIRGLWENQNASQDQLDAALAQSQSARARVDSALQSLEAAQRKLEYTTLASPVNGSIASVDVEVNENLQQGQKVVLLTSGARPEVEIAVPEVLISQVREGAPVTVTFDALPDRAFDAVVTEVGVAATGAATTFPVTVRLSRASPDVRSGMAANVEIRFESDGRQRIYLPTHAVGGDREGRFVFVLGPGEQPGVGVVRRTPVEVGRVTGDGLEILSGLADGQQVVTAGVRRLSDGEEVKLLATGDSR